MKEETSHQVIRVGRDNVGIMGLPEAIAEIQKQNLNSDEEIAENLFSMLKQQNYIAPGAEQEYKKAFLREYNRETGQPVAEDENVTEIKVLGPGCAQCHSLTEKIKKSLAEMNLAIGVEEVKDLKEISQHGVFGTPALIINGKLKITGRVPSDKQLKSWLEELRPSAQRKT